MKEKGYTYRQIADQFGMEKEQIDMKYGLTPFEIRSKAA